MIGEMLFGKREVFKFIEDEQKRLRLDYDSLSDADAADEAVVEHLKARYKLDVPVLDRENMSYDVHQRQMTMNDFKGRNVIGPAGQKLHDVSEYIIHIPFTGDRRLFEVNPATIDGRAAFGDLHGDEIVLTFRIDSAEFNLQGEIDQQLATINKKLNALRGSSLYMDQQIATTLAYAKQARQRAVENRESLNSVVLNIPRRIAPASVLPSQAAQVVTKLAPRLVAITQEWDVFISHASEDAAYAASLADALEKSGIRTWLDKDTLRWGQSLRTSIDNGLKKSRYVMVILSKSFLARKKWTEYELTGAFARETADEYRILPIWHGITENDLKEYSPSLTDRLSRQSDKHSVGEIVHELQSLLENTARPSPPTTTHSGMVTAAKAGYIRKLTGETKTILVRRSSSDSDIFAIEDHQGEKRSGGLREIAMEWGLSDRTLRLDGYVLNSFANLCGLRQFDLSV